MEGYKPRKIGNRDTRKFVVIVCEGKKTEIQYFNGFNERYSGVKVLPLHGKCTDAKSIIYFAEEQITKYNLNFDDGDQIWCAFDVDDKPKKEIEDAINHVQSKNINIALSNPCIELWFLLHFKQISSPRTRKEVEQELKNFIKDYEKDKNVFPILKEKIPIAIKAAKILNQNHQKSGKPILSVENNPSSQVFTMIENIHALIEKNKKYVK